jgi:transcriptional regulator with XRE-family HTH domain
MKRLADSVLNLNRITFGGRIRHHRDRAGMRQIDLRQKTGLSASFISDVENDKRQVSASNLHLIAKALGVSMDELFTGKVR